MKKKTVWIGLAVIFIIALSLFIYQFNKVDVEKLSLCLKEKQAKMYGGVLVLPLPEPEKRIWRMVQKY